MMFGLGFIIGHIGGIFIAALMNIARENDEI